MKTLKLTLIMVFAMTTFSSLDAQLNGFGKRLQNKLERKLEQRAEQKIDEELDKTLDEAFEKKEEEEMENEEEAEYVEEMEEENSSIDFGALGMKTVVLTEEYRFSTQVDWEITTQREKERTSMAQLFPEQGTYFGMEIAPEKKSKQGNFVYDLSNNRMIIFTGEENQAMMMALNLEDQMEEVNEERGDVKITPTTEQKKILGYTCTKYLFESEESEGDVWITKDLTFKNHNLLAQMQASKNSSRAKNAAWTEVSDGFALEVNSREKNEKKWFKMEAKAIDTKINTSYDMKDYKVTDFTQFSKGGRR